MLDPKLPNGARQAELCPGLIMKTPSPTAFYNAMETMLDSFYGENEPLVLTYDMTLPPCAAENSPHVEQDAIKTSD